MIKQNHQTHFRQVEVWWSSGKDETDEQNLKLETELLHLLEEHSGKEKDEKFN